MTPDEGLRVFAAEIAPDPLMGLAFHRPEKWARATVCFENVLRKVEQDGGECMFGWHFNYRISPEFGGYLFATHHAVWHAPGGNLVDVTPFHSDKKHHPLTVEGDVIFLVDNKAQPSKTTRAWYPLPLRFFPLEQEERLVAYVRDLQDEENQAWRKLFSETEGTNSGHES